MLDLAAYIAGTYCPTLLADLGAEVLKVEPPDGGPFRLTGTDFVGLNRGKRSISLDLKREEARNILYRLVTQADVVVQNFRPGVAERLALDYRTLSRLNDRVVYASISAYGPDGPQSGEPAFDQLMLAQSGIMKAQGSPGGEPICLTQAVADFGGAMLMTFGIMVALHERAHSGLGQHVETSLLRAAIAIQAGEFLFSQPAIPRPAGGVDFRGPSAFYSCYRASDDWVLIDLREPASRERFNAILEPEAASEVRLAVAEGDDASVRKSLGTVVGTRGRADWVAACNASRIPATSVRTWDQILKDPVLWQSGWLNVRPHSVWGDVTQLGNVLRSEPEPPRMAPLLGEHTRSVLAEIGYTAAEVQGFVDNGIAFEDAPRAQR